MMASAYPHHPGGLQQPGMPHGHPMGPGPGPNPGPPMGQPMQMHPGVSGPGGPHVSQAGPMMGMQPGVGGPGPSAHALSHLTPQAHMFQQHQQMPQAAFQGNPALAMQQQRQQALMRQQQQQQMMQQQQNGLPMGFPNGNPGITPQQLQAMQAAGNPPFAVNLPPHMRQQLAHQQQAAMQQQHQAQQAQAQQAQAQAQAQAQQQHQSMAQHMAMQHAASQQSNPGQGGPPGPQGPPGQQGQMRPQPQMPPGHEAQASPAPPPSQHPTPQQTQSQPPPPQQVPTPNPQQNAQPGPPQPPQPQQPQQPQQQNPQQLQQQQQQQRQQQQVAQQRALAMQQQQAQAQAQAQNRMYGTTILKLLQLADHLSRFSASRMSNNIDYWRSFVSRFFSEEGVFKQALVDYAPNAGKPKHFEICNPALPRYYYTQIQSGVENIQLTMDGTTEKEFGNNCHYVESNRAKFIYWFKNGSQVVFNGKLSAMFDQNDKINLLVFETADYQTFLPRSQLEELFTLKSPTQNLSPKMSKKNQQMQRNQQRQQMEPSLLKSELPEAPVNLWGVTGPVLQFLEVGETLANMQDLFAHYHANPGQTPSQCMSNYVASINPQQMQHPNQPGLPPSHLQQANPQLNLPPGVNNGPPGSRTPSGAMQAPNPNMQPRGPEGQFMSPHIANLQFPGGLNPAVNGSPHLVGQTHTPSPAQAHMQAPGLVAQHSQQGNNSNGASANTSPNVTNKRRRSTVKQEGDEGGGDINGANRVKPSPKIGVNKRIKGNA